MLLRISRRGFVASTGAAAIAGTGVNARPAESLGIKDLCVDGIPNSLNLHTAAPSSFVEASIGPPRHGAAALSYWRGQQPRECDGRRIRSVGQRAGRKLAEF